MDKKTDMISIIICSRKVDISDELKTNIATTIGCEYELCVIDNSSNSYNIFTAYNEGVKRAKGDVLCFVHEDVVFHTDNWGVDVTDLFLENCNIGAVGVVGGQYLSRNKVAWWDASPMIGEIIQGSTDKFGKYSAIFDSNGRVKNVTDVVAVDGCFLCIRASLFHNNIRWDDVSYKGFHLYDVDIAMQIIDKGYRVCICPGLLIEHKSRGCANGAYYDALNVFCCKWESKLPMYRGIEYKRNEVEWRERITDSIILQRILENRIHKLEKSKAYRLGKFFMKPFYVIRDFVNKK